MVFEKRTERRENRAQEINATPESEDISVFPMAIPMIAGPGSIASIMLLMAQSNGIEESFIVLGALAAILLLTMIALLMAGQLMRFLRHAMDAMIPSRPGGTPAALADQAVMAGVSLQVSRCPPHHPLRAQ